MDLFYGYFWIFGSKLMLILIWVFTRIFKRCEAINSGCSSKHCNEIYETSYENYDTLWESNNTIEQECGEVDSNGCEIEEQSNEDLSDIENLEDEEKETNKLVFKFQYQTWNYSEKFSRKVGESYDFQPNSNTNKYELIPGKIFSHFLEEPEVSSFTVKELYVHSKDCALEENDSSPSPETNFIPEEENDKVDDFICSSIELDSMSSVGEGFLSDTDFVTTIEHDSSGNYDEHEGLKQEDFAKESENFDDEDIDIVGEVRKIEEESRLHNSEMDNMVKLRDDCFQHSHRINSKLEESVKSNSHGSTGLDRADSTQFDTLWEHQYLIEEVKMELKKVIATGLPTMLENYESPRIMEVLKPWKIEEQFQHDCTINDLPKAYMSYRERMRKFDILNYQKMYALGTLQLKDPLQSFSSSQNSSPAITSFLPNSFRLRRRKKTESEYPMKKFIKEFYSDLEMVYVGQLCLSWEILKWEYEKVLNLWESDQYRLQRYNEVAGEFQQFQVLLQRFIENEPFQGPRVQNYARNRCVMCNLLQVPIIREDNATLKCNDKNKLRDKDVITSQKLLEILEESIRTIWCFIRADKDASKGTREIQVELQDPADSDFLKEIRAQLLQKEKIVSEFLKNRSCILNKFQNHEKDESDNFHYFFSEVDMKLVWRVLNMSRITNDQLTWCHNKLNNINFVNRRIIIETSFLLFPC
ncbi:hypothetical protein Lal_00005870 [Lupinus albus]|uniref:Putative ribosomal protein L34Ae n=1 Tax=Lupinus albus TaxID=3870 RepID=A0A6A5MX44_LUPAL|nr:putative ribosomal protein L34Ae [Lupinus albus]KAF1879404.1 hypothetical protein Lal_00005870 [Lupinus albus]